MRAREARSSASARRRSRDVAQVAGEHRRAGNVDAGDRELDREARAVGAHAVDLDPPVQHPRRAAGEVPREPSAVAVAQVRRHDQLRHLAADRLLARVAERALGGGVELDDAAAMVHRHDAVQRGLQRRAVALLAGVVGVLGRRRSTSWPSWPPTTSSAADEVGVGLARARAEDLDDADDAALAAHREADRRVHAGGRRGGPPRQPVVGRGVGHPDRPPGLPDAPGQALAPAQRGRARRVRERPRAVVVGRPDRHAPQHVGVGVRRLPGGGERPVEPAAMARSARAYASPASVAPETARATACSIRMSARRYRVASSAASAAPVSSAFARNPRAPFATASSR